MERKKASDFPPEVMKLFDGYVHGALSRRDFLDRAGKFAVGAFGAAAMLESLQPNFAWAQQVPMDDKRIKAGYMEYDSPNGSGKMRGYLAQPAKAAKEKAPKEAKAPKVPKPAKGEGAKDRLEQIRLRAEELGLGADVKTDDDGEAVDPEAFAAAVDAVAQVEQTEAVDA